MRPGLTLVEVIVAMGLLGLLMVFILNLFPSSSLALRRASDVLAGTAYAVDMLERARSDTSLVGNTEFDVELEGTRFHLVRRAVPIGTDRVDLVVTLEAPRTTTLRLGTRLERAP